jgi:hypothetical protein
MRTVMSLDVVANRCSFGKKGTRPSPDFGDADGARSSGAEGEGEMRGVRTSMPRTTSLCPEYILSSSPFLKSLTNKSAEAETGICQ